MILLGQAANDEDAQSEDTWADEPARASALHARQISQGEAVAGHVHNHVATTAEQYGAGGDSVEADGGVVETIVSTATAGQTVLQPANACVGADV